MERCRVTALGRLSKSTYSSVGWPPGARHERERATAQGTCPVTAVRPAWDSARTTLWIGLAAAVLLIAVTAPFMSRYGWDRDELYFLSAAHHLALGYVDFPPLIAAIGWIVDGLAPNSLIALRMVSLAAGAGTVILIAFIARELGEGYRAQGIAALA